MGLLWTLSLIFIAGTAQAEMYRWVDAEGKVHYSDTKPPSSAKKVEEKSFGGNVAVSTENMPYSVQLAVKNFPVTLYTGDCGEACKNAQAYLSKRGVPYTLRLPGTKQEDVAAFKQVSSDNMIPVLVVGKVYTLKGYSESEWASALDQAGYPKSNAFPGGKAPPPATTKTEKQPIPASTPASTTPPAEAGNKGY